MTDTARLEALEAFFAWAMDEIWGEGTLDLEGCEIQDKALELGLLRHVPYDPEIHGTHAQDEYDMKPGDDWLERVPDDEPPSPVTKVGTPGEPLSPSVKS